MSGRRTVSIDIGSKNLHIVEGVYKGNVLEIDKIIEFPTPTNSYLDGRIEDRAALKEAIRTSLTQNRIRTRDAIISVQGASVINRELVLPEVKSDQLGSMVRYEMEQYLPDAIGKYYIEFRVIGRFVEEGVAKLKIRAAAMLREIVDSYYKLLGELRLRPYALDTHLNSISKVFEKPAIINSEQYDTVQTVSVIDFGHRNTVINIISKGVLDFSRSVTYGTRDLDTALASYFDISIEKAEQKKINELRLDRLDESTDTGESIGASVRTVLQQWMTELQKVFQFYTSRNPDSRISTLYIYGGGANLKGFPEYLKQWHGINSVQKIGSIGSVKIKNSAGITESGCCLNATGAIIRL